MPHVLSSIVILLKLIAINSLEQHLAPEQILSKGLYSELFTVNALKLSFAELYAQPHLKALVAHKGL